MSRLQFTDQADADLLEIAFYIAHDSEAAADRLVAPVGDVCRLLAERPEMGRRREELSVRLRSFPVGNYMIYYRSIQNGIEVIRILHGSRDVDALWEQ